MFEFLKTKQFAMFFSFVLGMALVCLFQPLCVGPSCEVHKAPSIDEMKRSTYKLGSKCYQFQSSTISCPASGYVEAFSIAAQPPAEAAMK
jgi:hypothetical protein